MQSVWYHRKQIYLTKRWDPNRCTTISESEWIWVWWQWKGNSSELKPHYWCSLVLHLAHYFFNPYCLLTLMEWQTGSFYYNQQGTGAIEIPWMLTTKTVHYLMPLLPSQLLTVSSYSLTYSFQYSLLIHIW